MSHIYKNVVKKEPEATTVREMVAKYGDNWRLWMPKASGHEWRDRLTFDEWEATTMKHMETGLFPRIRPEDQ